MSGVYGGEGGVLVSERRRLTDLAYRLLGSVAEAEDAVQETYARWYAMSPERRAAVRVPGAWLTTVAGRVCLDLLGSARVRRERYVGAWLPEPLPDRGEWGGGTAADPAELVTLDESVHMAFLVVLEAMTPAERVAFVLHDVFGYPFAEVAAIVGRTPAACRQLASSARRRVAAAKAPAAPAAAGQAGVVREFKEAWEAKDIGALVGLLDPDAVMTADGGGLVGTVLRPVEGGRRIADYLLFIAGKAPGLRLLERSVNGRPGLVARLGDVTVTVAAFDLGEDDGRVRRIWVVRNPEKLRPWSEG
ncbi:RNA polymerase sigma factor SigJ [Streptomyces sp. NPDC093111]|uniref:RNA polymerase sigma factor SigJ n=1 Tax=Streptomyces sp. NPDC093111 TaxID=3154978 RepID=UPI0034459C63